jgi:hypothetical protein
LTGLSVRRSPAAPGSKGRKIERMPFNTVVLSADVNDAADVIT